MDRGCCAAFTALPQPSSGLITGGSSIRLTGTALQDLYNDGLLSIDADGNGNMNENGKAFFGKFGFHQVVYQVHSGDPFDSTAGARFVSEKVVEVTGLAMNGDANQAQVEYKTEYVFADQVKPVTKYLSKDAGNHKVTMRKYDDGWRLTN